MSLPKQKLDYVEELYDMYYQKLSDLGLPIREVILEANPYNRAFALSIKKARQDRKK